MPTSPALTEKEFNLLGKIEILEKGKLSPLMKSAQGCALIAYLLITKQSHSREHLADLFWGEAGSTADSLLKLRKLLYRIRPHVPELEVTRQHVAIQLDPAFHIDLYTLESALMSEAQDQLDHGLALYPRELLDGFYLDQSPSFNEWLTIEREKLRQRVWDGYRQLCSAYQHQQAWQLGVSAAERWLALDPIDEEVLRQLLRFLSANGQLLSAIDRYESARQLLLSELGIEPELATKALFAQIEEAAQQVRESQHASITVGRQNYWGEAPDAVEFFGREAELTQLDHWLATSQNPAGLITVLGIGGQGKTTLAAHAARRHADQFDSVYWRSLINAPPLEAVLAEYIDFLTHNQTVLPDSIPAQLVELRRLLQQERHLLILDNLETVLDEQHAGQFREGYQEYEELLQLWGAGGHSSTLLITSREAPLLLNRLKKQSRGVVTLPLHGLTSEAGAQILAAGRVETTEALALSLTQRYSGNPLALQLAAQIVEEFYFGDLDAFLADESPIFEDVRHLISSQFQRLTPLEQEVLIWLAITREATRPKVLTDLILRPIQSNELLLALQKLQRRSLLQREQTGFTLQNVIMEYLTDRLTTVAAEEIRSGEFDYVSRYALMLANVKTYVRQSQVRILLQPIEQKLATVFHQSVELVPHVAKLLKQIRHKPEIAEGYAAGNLLNLLLQTNQDLSRLDFSCLKVREAFLQGARLPRVNFAESDLSGAVFTDRFGHSFSLAISPDGEYLAAGMRKGEIRVWRLTGRQPHIVIPAHTDTIWEITFSPKSQILFSCGADHQIYAWDVKSGKRLYALQGHTALVWSVAVSPDEKMIVSAGNDSTLRFWDFETGRCEAVLDDETNILKEIIFSGDGRLLATFSKNVPLRIWDVKSRTLNHKLSKMFEKTVVDAAAFSPDGRLLAFGGVDQEPNLYLWDLEQGVMVHNFSDAFERMLEVIFSPDGKLLACSTYDKTVRIWDIASGEIRSVMRGHTASPLNIAFTPDSLALASSGYDQRINLWDVETGRIRYALLGHTGMIRRLKFSNNGKQLASSNTNGEFCLWSIESVELLKQLQATPPQPTVLFPGDSVGAGKFTTFALDDKTLITGSDDPLVRLWDIESGRCVKQFEGHSGEIYHGTISPDGKLLATCDWGTNQLVIWEWPQGNMLGSYLLEQGHAHEIHFMPDSETLMVANEDHTIAFWYVPDLINLELNTKIGLDIKPYYQLVGHDMLVFSAVPSPDGKRVVSGAGDQTVRLWDISDLLDYSPARSNGQHALDSDQIKTQTDCVMLKGHVGWIWSVDFHPSGKMVASAGEDRVIRLWDVETGTLIRIFEGHSLWIYSISFSPNGKLLASTGGDETVRIWEVDTGDCLAIWQAPGPYEGMDISDIKGLSAVQKAELLTLGAIEK